MMPEQITTAEQLKALPLQAVVIGIGSNGKADAFQAGLLPTAPGTWHESKWTQPGVTGFYEAGEELPVDAEEVLNRYLAVFVVWKPGQPTDGTPRE